MRALAVLSVLFYHLDLQFIPGGFLGVDLFFLISGFIISRNIIMELESGKFTIGTFYYRRFRRLLPALIVTVLLTLLAGYFIIPPVQLALSARSALYSLLSIGNFNFWLEAGYFDSSAQSKPFLHTWSLGVEEQFYFFWPALLLLSRRRNASLWMILGLLGGSILLSFYYSDTAPDALFYLLPFRVHQFMAGALIAIVAFRFSAALSNGLSMLAVFGIIYAMTTMGAETPTFVSSVVISTIGLFLLLTRESQFARIALGNSVMIWIGARSYALYLVHWPLVVLWKYVYGFDLTLGDQAALAVGSFALAVVLHEVIEKPFRMRGPDLTLWKRSAMPVSVGLMVVAVFTSANFWGFDGYPKRIPADIRLLVEKIDHQRKLRLRHIRHGKCNLHTSIKFHRYRRGVCGALKPGKANVLIIGDSHAADSYMMLKRTYPDIRFAQATAGSCPAIHNLPKGKYESCQRLNSYRFSVLSKRNFDLVILAANWHIEQLRDIKKTVLLLKRQGREVLVLGPQVTFSESVPLLVSRELSARGINIRVGHEARQQTELLAAIRKAIPGTQVVDMGKIQCKPQCTVAHENALLYWDSHHLTPEGAEFVGQRFKQEVDLRGLIDFDFSKAESTEQQPPMAEKVDGAVLAISNSVYDQ